MATPGEPRSRRDERVTEISGRVYRRLLRVYPRGLRDEYGDEMARCFQDLCREALESGGLGLAALWVRTVPELLHTAVKERSAELNRNVYRSIAGVALTTAFVLLIPLLAAPAWTLFDFVFAGVLIFGTGLAYSLAASKRGDIAYRAAAGVALAAAFMLVWAVVAVGVIGSESNPANLMYFGVLAVGIAGAFIVRFEPRGMARAMAATAVVQGLVAVIALVYGVSGAGEILAPNSFFAALFAGSALLFRRADPRSG